MLNYAAIGTVKRENSKKATGTVVWVEGYDPGGVTIVYVLFFFVCVYWERVKILYPLVATSLEGLQWWSLIISLNVQGNRKKKIKKSDNNNKNNKIGK